MIGARISSSPRFKREILSQPPVVSGRPFAWYAPLDLNLVPYDVSGGVYGAQSSVQAPEAPFTSTGVNVSTNTEFNNAIAAGERVITVTANLEGPNANPGTTVNGIDIIIPPGITVYNPVVRNTATVAPNKRIRYRGPTLGQYSGGRVHRPWLIGYWSDVIYDGLGITGPGLLGNDGTPAIYYADRMGKLAIVNCRGITGACFFLGADVEHVTIAGNSIATGQLVPRPAGDESWFARFGLERPGNIAIYGNSLRGTRFHSIRLHPLNGNLQNYAWIANNHFVDQVEAKLLWVDSASSSGDPGTDQMAAVWVENNVMDLNGGKGFEINDANYLYHRNNTYYGNYSAGDINVSGAIASVNTPNTYNAQRTIPSWAAMQALGYGCGDPTGLTWNDRES